MNKAPTNGGTPPNRRRSVTRRRTAAITAIAAATALFLSACAGTGSGAGADSTDFGDLKIQLSYKKNQQSAGMYVADDKGYFADAGFDAVELVAGGTGTSAEAATGTGQVLIGISGPLTTAPAIAEGGEVKIIGTIFQKNPFAVVSAADAPLNGPDDLVGKTIAVQDFNTLVWNAFLTANDLTADDVTTVPFSDTSQLTTGQVDGFIGFTTTGAAALNAAGFDATEFLLEDNGLPMIGESLVASDDAIKNRRPELVAALGALVKGWDEAVADPELSTDLTVNVYGKDQSYDPEAIALSVDRQNTLIATDETEANGLLTISPEKQASTVASLELAGISTTTEDLFDLTLLTEALDAQSGS
ncbi:MAG: ABC transporter substrate-binding protein [Mycetocola sp.]